MGDSCWQNTFYIYKAGNREQQLELGNKDTKVKDLTQVYGICGTNARMQTDSV